jgi:alpha-galactosidase
MIKVIKSEENDGDKTLTFSINTEHTSYIFRTLPTGQLEHLYYGRRISISGSSDIAPRHISTFGNAVSYDRDHPEIALEDIMLETSAAGKGDIRDPQFIIESADGSRTLDFVFKSYEISKWSCTDSELPHSYGDDAEVLKVDLFDRNHGISLSLFYIVYFECDVISRYSLIVNNSENDIYLDRALSATLDFPSSGYKITSFHGGWVHEMEKTENILTGGRFINSSSAGVSSNRSNPFIMMSVPGTDEDRGAVYGFNLIYSGNFYESFDVNQFGKTRVLSGINPLGFRFTLSPGESFETPEMVFSFSDKGYNGLSVCMHYFVKKHVMRGYWRDKNRPVILNSWETFYFNINEKKLLSLARAGKEIGAEILVMDDGWFSGRTDDKKALGDWTFDKKKLPGGLKRLSDRVHEIGMKFGIWIEPEMISVDSDLFRAHPDWSMAIPGMNHSEGRNERFLDLANPKVTDYMISKITSLLESAKIEYVKWDMNRIMSDVYSPYLKPDRQGECAHRYILGFYRMIRELKKAFPEILWEGCASGGCRFDLGALSYFDQIWASDNTDPMSRVDIQTGLSYGYPQISYTAHISSSPSHQDLRVSSLDTRMNIAFFSSLGIEMNIMDMNKNDKERLKEGIALYKKKRQLFQFGQLYRTDPGLAEGRVSGNNPFTDPGPDNVITWTVVSHDGKEAAAVVAEKRVRPGNPHLYFFPRGLDEERLYHIKNVPGSIDIHTFGDLINAAGLPVHVRQDSFLHETISRFVKIPYEKEDRILYGNALMYAGLELTEGYCGCGIENLRIMTDNDSRLYFIDAENGTIPKESFPGVDLRSTPRDEARHE